MEKSGNPSPKMRQEATQRRREFRELLAILKAP